MPSFSFKDQADIPDTYYTDIRTYLPTERIGFSEIGWNSSGKGGEAMQAAFWDYNVDASQIYLIALGQVTGTAFFTREKVLCRLLERLSWYELIDLFGREFLTSNITKSIVNKLRNPEMRNRYEFIKRILQGEALSSTGWSDQNRKRLGAAVLSNRWYSLK